MFFSRRIGLQDGRTVPIRAGGRLTGKAGPYSIGVLNVQTEEAGAGRRDQLLGRAGQAGRPCGAAPSGRFSRAVRCRSTGAGSNQVYGVDGLFSFYDNLNITSYLAQSRRPGVSRGDAVSYQTRLDYRGDRWGLLAERLAVGADFSRKWASSAGTIFDATSWRAGSARVHSPSRRSASSCFQGSLDYTTDSAGLLETRVRQGLFGIELENGDLFFAGATDSFELLKRAVRDDPGHRDSPRRLPLYQYPPRLRAGPATRRVGRAELRPGRVLRGRAHRSGVYLRAAPISRRS